MPKFFFALLLLATPVLGVAQDDHYNLLNSLDPAAAPQMEEDRVPASIEPGQISVRERLPDARLEKTARTLQWEVLENKTGNLEESEAEPQE